MPNRQELNSSGVTCRSINNSGRKWRRDLSPADESSKEYGIVHPFLCNEIKRENIEKQEKEQSRHINEEIHGPVKCL